MEPLRRFCVDCEYCASICFVLYWLRFIKCFRISWFRSVIDLGFGPTGDADFDPLPDLIVSYLFPFLERAYLSLSDSLTTGRGDCGAACINSFIICSLLTILTFVLYFLCRSL